MSFYPAKLKLYMIAACMDKITNSIFFMLLFVRKMTDVVLELLKILTLVFSQRLLTKLNLSTYG